MLILKLSQIVDIVVDDDPQAIGLAVRCNIVLGECLGHGECDIGHALGGT